MTDQEEEFILDCIEKMVENTIKDDDAKKLDKLITDDAESCTFYNDIMAQHAALKDSGPIKVQDIEEEKKNAMLIFYKISLVAAAMFIVFLGVSLIQMNSKGKALSIASISKTENCKWLNSSLPTSVGAELTSGKLSLESGLATIKFTSGAEIVLEAPASIELVDAMHCRILDGTVLAKVPESAHGFKVDTPTASTIDHGTEFLVSYNSKSAQSLVEVLEGEVEVRPADIEESKRLFTGDSALINQSTIEDSKPVEGMPNNSPSIASNALLISTETGTGDDAYIVQSKVKGHDSNILLMVKNSETEHKRKSYLKFDLKNMTTDFKSVALHLSIQSSGFGFSSLVPDSTFSVYGLTDDSLDNWSREKLNWQNAPVNTDDNNLDKASLVDLGSFEIKRGTYSGIVTLESKELADFIKADSNKIATLIIIRNTGEFSKHGLVHAFASKRHPSAMAPTLEFKK